jgi:hypothetical protein
MLIALLLLGFLLYWPWKHMHWPSPGPPPTPGPAPTVYNPCKKGASYKALGNKGGEAAYAKANTRSALTAAGCNQPDLMNTGGEQVVPADLVKNDPTNTFGCCACASTDTSGNDQPIFFGKGSDCGGTLTREDCAQGARPLGEAENFDVADGSCVCAAGRGFYHGIKLSDKGPYTQPTFDCAGIPNTNPGGTGRSVQPPPRSTVAPIYEGCDCKDTDQLVRRFLPDSATCECLIGGNKELGRDYGCVDVAGGIKPDPTWGDYLPVDMVNLKSCECDSGVEVPVFKATGDKTVGFTKLSNGKVGMYCKKEFPEEGRGNCWKGIGKDGDTWKCACEGCGSCAGDKPTFSAQAEPGKRTEDTVAVCCVPPGGGSTCCGGPAARTNLRPDARPPHRQKSYCVNNCSWRDPTFRIVARGATIQGRTVAVGNRTPRSVAP